jgi:hypothetical protein
MNEAHRINKRLRRIAKLQDRVTEAQGRRDRAKANNEHAKAAQIQEREVGPAIAIYNAAVSSAAEMRRVA